MSTDITTQTTRATVSRSSILVPPPYYYDKVGKSYAKERFACSTTYLKPDNGWYGAPIKPDGYLYEHMSKLSLVQCTEWQDILNKIDNESDGFIRTFHPQTMYGDVNELTPRFPRFYAPFNFCPVHDIKTIMLGHSRHISVDDPGLLYSIYKPPEGLTKINTAVGYEKLTDGMHKAGINVDKSSGGYYELFMEPLFAYDYIPLSRSRYSSFHNIYEWTFIAELLLAEIHKTSPNVKVLTFGSTANKIARNVFNSNIYFVSDPESAEKNIPHNICKMLQASGVDCIFKRSLENFNALYNN